MQTYKQGTARAPGLIYRIGTTSMVIGLLVSLGSGVLGGIVFAATMALFKTLGAPEDRNYLSVDYPQTGTEILLLLSTGIFFSGLFIYSSRLLIELLGLPVERHVSLGFTLGDKLLAGIATIGTLIFTLTFTPLFLLEFLLANVFYENPAEAFAPTLELIGGVGMWLMIGGLIIFFLMRPHRLPNLFGWMVNFGWGRLGWTRVNLTASVLILVAIVCQMFGWNSIFGLTMNMIVGTGFVMILTGIVPHFLTRGKP